jgi:molybdenum cofactor synthesis domain-containing protein
MIPLGEAQGRVRSAVSPLPVVSMPIGEAVGLVIAERVTAPEAIPPFANTAMDGFAIRSSDLVGASETSPVELPIVATVAAGTVASRALEPGEAMRIMTGAPMPAGADAVIMVELTETVDDRVRCRAAVPAANHVRGAGDDLEAGAVVFEPGTVIGPTHVGVLASVGRTDVAVHRRPRVGVFSTGDELVEGPGALEPGQIRDSNRPQLLALVAEAGADPVDLGVLRDDYDEIDVALRAAAESCDALITSGGVSMGDFDFVKQVLSTLGDLTWMQVAIKPAKPLAFGVLFGTPIFGLPGNPVSSAVSFELFARPALRMMMGRPDLERVHEVAIVDEALGRGRDGKTHFQRVIATQESDGWHVRSAGGQGSHQLAALAAANGLAVIPDGDGVDVGERVRVMLLS